MELETIYKTREEWLTEAKNLLQDRIFRVWDLPEGIKISCGPCPKKAIGVCFNKKCSENGNIEIFISPKISEELRVLDVLIHELIHAYLGLDKKHNSQFAKIAREVGLLEPWKATTASGELNEELKLILPNLGKYPHSKLKSLKKEVKEEETKEQKAKMYLCSGSQEKLHEEWKCLVKKKFFEIAEPICPICGNPMIWDELSNKKLLKKEK